MRNNLIIAAVVTILSMFLPKIVANGTAAAEAEGAVELSRPYKALPWLNSRQDVPFDVVPFDSIGMLAGFPRKTPYYEVDPDVVASAYSYFFYVRGVNNEYQVGSVVGLVKLCHELAVLEEIKHRNKGKEVATGAGRSMRGIGSGLANLVMHPGISMRNAGEHARQTGRTIERAVGGSDKVGKAESGADRSLLGDGPAGAARRALAYELGVDVYTSNPDMQQALIDLSQLQAAGGAVTWVMPYGTGMLGNFNTLGGEDRAETLIRDFAPYELRRQVGVELEPVLGMSREDRGGPLYRLLMNPNFTPRDIAYIGFDLLSMHGVGNLRIVVETLAGVDSPEEADMLSFQLRLYSFLHRRVQPLREFLPGYQNLFAAMGGNGVFYVLFFGDILRPWNANVEPFAQIVKEAMDHKATGMEFWMVGDVDPQVIQNVVVRNVTVRQNILRDPVFFPGPEQRR